MSLGLLTAGLGFASSLLGSRQTTRTTSEVDYQKMVENAQAAGFNPLTALRNGGTAGFTSTTSTGALSSAGALASAANNGVQTYFNMQDRQLDREREHLEQALLREELRDMQSRSAVAHQGAFGDVIPRISSYGVNDGTRSGLPALASDRAAVSRGVRDGTIPGVLVGGQGIAASPDWSDAQAFEDRYGDVASAAYGFGVMGADLVHNFRDYILGPDISPEEWRAYFNEQAMEHAPPSRPAIDYGRAGKPPRHRPRPIYPTPATWAGAMHDPDYRYPYSLTGYMAPALAY